MPQKLAFVVEYEGTGYHGFQVQAGVPTVQSEIERSINKVTAENIRITGAGRTDAGVHALGQVISFRTESSLSAETLVRALNFYLPGDIRIKAGASVDTDFDARRDARSRRYRYTVMNDSIPSPLYRRFSHFVSEPLDEAAMDEACRCLTGKHDFASFTVPTDASTVRMVSSAGVRRQGNLLFFDVAANAFLMHQVRRMMGALLDVGAGRMKPLEIADILEARKAGMALFTAPALGLCLMSVEYVQGKFVRGTAK